jgi:hypothetical protein
MVFGVFCFLVFFSFSGFVSLTALGIELRASHVLGKCSITLVTLPALSVLVIF